MLLRLLFTVLFALSTATAHAQPDIFTDSTVATLCGLDDAACSSGLSGAILVFNSSSGNWVAVDMAGNCTITAAGAIECGTDVHASSCAGVACTREGELCFQQNNNTLYCCKSAVYTSCGGGSGGGTQNVAATNAACQALTCTTAEDGNTCWSYGDNEMWTCEDDGTPGWARYVEDNNLATKTEGIDDTQIVIGQTTNVAEYHALTGDVTMTNQGVTSIGADKIIESMLKVVGSPTDEYCLTYEATVGDFAWQACTAGEVNNLSTVMTGVADDQVAVGASPDIGAYKTLPDTNTAGQGFIGYDTATNVFAARAVTLSGADVTGTLPDANISGVNERDEVCNTTTLDSTCEVRADIIDTVELADGLSPEDGDYIDFGTFISSATEGLFLPAHLTSCATATGESQVCWEEDAAQLWIGNGASSIPFVPAPNVSGAITMSNTGATTLAASIVGASNMADQDHGDVAWSGGVATITGLDNDDLTDNQIGDLLDVSEAGATTGMVLVSDGAGAWSAAAQDDIPDAGDFTNLTAGAGMSKSTGTLAVELLTSLDSLGLASSNSGLEFNTSGDGGLLTMLQGCLDGEVLAWIESTDEWTCSGVASGSGDVVGPASATDNAIARFNTTTGKLIQNSGVTVDDSGNLIATGYVDGFCTPASNDCGVTLEHNTSTMAAPGAGFTNLGANSTGLFVRHGVAAATYVCEGNGANCPAGDGLVVSGSTLNVEPLSPGADADSTTASSASGLEIVSNELTLLRGCAADEGMKWNETSDLWECGLTSGGSDISFDTTNDGVNESSTMTHIECSSDAGLNCNAPATNQLQIDLASTVSLLDQTIESSEIADGAILSADIFDGTIVTADIFDGTVTGTDIANNTVVLTTDTTGDYMAGLTGGTGIAVTHTPAEGSTATVATASQEADFLADGDNVALTVGAGMEGKMQVNDSGGLEYVTGEGTPAVRTVFPIVIQNGDVGTNATRVIDFSPYLSASVSTGTCTADVCVGQAASLACSTNSDCSETEITIGSNIMTTSTPIAVAQLPLYGTALFASRHYNYAMPAGLRYVPVYGESSAATVAGEMAMTLPALSCRELVANVTVATPASTTVTVTLSNFTTTTTVLTCDIAAAGTACTSTGAVATAAGDRLEFSYICAGAGCAAVTRNLSMHARCAFTS